MQQFCNLNLDALIKTQEFRTVILILFLVACCYAALVEWLHRRGWETGIVWALVVVGVSFTVGGLVIPFYGIEPAIFLLIGFSATGLPMSVGSILHYMMERKKTRLESEKALFLLQEKANGGK